MIHVQDYVVQFGIFPIGVKKHFDESAPLVIAPANHFFCRFTKNPFHYREIASDNDLRNPHLIFPGQHLTLRIRRLAPASSP